MPSETQKPPPGSKWHVIYPSSHLADNSTCISIILVNTALDTNSWSQVPLKDSDDVTIIQLHLPQGQLTIFNIYNDCTHSDTLTQIHQFLGQHASILVTSKTDHMVWSGDFNQHHPLWDEECNKHLLM